MDWNLITAIGALDAIMIVLFGIYAAIVIVSGRDTTTLNDKVGPAVMILVVTSIVVCVFLALTQWLAGPGPSLMGYIGRADAILVTVAGIAAALIVLLGKDSNVFWYRVLPATAILVGTTLASGLVIGASRWLGGP